MLSTLSCANEGGCERKQRGVGLDWGGAIIMYIGRSVPCIQIYMHKRTHWNHTLISSGVLPPFIFLRRKKREKEKDKFNKETPKYCQEMLYLQELTFILPSRCVQVYMIHKWGGAPDKCRMMLLPSYSWNQVYIWPNFRYPSPPLLSKNCEAGKKRGGDKWILHFRWALMVFFLSLSHLKNVISVLVIIIIIIIITPPATTPLTN